MHGQLCNIFQGNFTAKDISLYQFLGNRLYIIFLNGAGIFELFSKLLSFLNPIDKESKIWAAAYYDVNVLQYGYMVIWLLWSKANS